MSLMHHREFVPVYPDHFVRDWIDPYLDEDGYAIESLSGKKRYFIFYDGALMTSWDKKELENNFPGKKALCYTFIPSKLSDNKKLLEYNPDYEAILDANTKAQKAALLDGCWTYQLDDGSYFNRDWLVTHNGRLPASTACARAWDKASSVPSDVNPNPDYTATFKMHKCNEGYYWIVGDCIDDVQDENNIFGRFRMLPGSRDTTIKEQAAADGIDCTVVFSKDPGQAGETEFQNAAKDLIEAGFIVRPDPMPSNKSKITRFSPFSSACQNGLVRILPHTFRNKATLEHILKELEKFNGEPSTARRKDD